jgi:hypothetical protein
MRKFIAVIALTFLAGCASTPKHGVTACAPPIEQSSVANKTWSEKLVLPVVEHVTESIPVPMAVAPSVVYAQQAVTYSAAPPVPSEPRVTVNKVKKTTVDEQLADYVPGTLGYKIPSTMRIGTTERVTIRVSKSELRGVAPNGKDVVVAPNGKDVVVAPNGKDVVVAPIKVYTYMAVKLIGDPKHFTINPISSEQQVVSISEDTLWDFDVTPQSLGTGKLTVRVSARIKVPNSSDETKDFPIYTKDVYIKTDWAYLIKRFLYDNWQWVLGTLLSSGLIGWAYSRYTNKGGSGA